MSQFIIRLVHFVANEVITKRLAQSPAFQRFALRTHDKVQAAKGIVSDPRQAEQALKEAEKAMREGLSSRGGRGGPQNAPRNSSTTNTVADDFRRFKEALREEVSRDFGGGKKQKK